MNKKFKNFIWNGKKKPRVAFSILTSNKIVGGMGLAEVKNYYNASLLDQMKHWFSSSEDKLWTNIEKEATLGHDLHALSMASYLLKKKSTYLI